MRSALLSSIVKGQPRFNYHKRWDIKMRFVLSHKYSCRVAVLCFYFNVFASNFNCHALNPLSYLRSNFYHMVYELSRKII